MPQVYSHMLSLCAMPLVSWVTHSHFWEIYTASRKKVACLSPEADITVLDRLQALLEHANQHVPFYRERFRDAGLSVASFRSVQELDRLPTLRKVDIARNFPDRITSEKQLHRPWRCLSTSGTIERLSIVHDFYKRDVVRALQLMALSMGTGYQFGLRYLEMPPNICRDVCGAADNPDPDFFQYAWQQLTRGNLFKPDVVSDLRGLAESQLLYRRLRLPSYWNDAMVQPGETLNRCLAEIDHYRPYVVKALPVYLYLLARHLHANPRKPPRIQRGLMPMGSSMTPHMKRIIEDAFEVPVFEDYGSAELGAMAAECRCRDGLHPFSSFFYIQILRGNRPAEPGEVGRVVVTDLSNYAMPLIRYEIGDVAILRRGACGCGGTGMRFEVAGRIAECMVARDGTVLTPDAVIDSILAHPGVLLFQLHRSPYGELDLQIVPAPGAAPNLAAITATLSELLGDQVRIHPRLVQNLQPEPGGKFRFIKGEPAPGGLL
jgi:phenylacetate-CoA ligase